MDTFMIGYDLNSPGQNYDKLIEALKGYGTYWHYLDSTWFIRAEGTPTTIRDALKVHIDPGDELMVTQVTGASAAWTGFTQSASDWLQKHL